MAGPLLYDRVKETSVTTGTGSFTLAGAVTGYRTFASALSVGDTFPYCIAAQGGTEWEVGIGTLSASTTLARTTVLASSNGGSAVNFSAGAKDVFLTYPAGRAVLKTGALASGRIPYVSANGELADDAELTFGIGALNLGSTAPSISTYKFSSVASGSATNAVQLILAVGFNSTGTPAAGLGCAFRFLCESTTTENQIQAAIESSWQTATHAGRAGDLTLYAYYTSTAQEAIRIRGAFPGVQIGVFGVTPVNRPAAYTQTYATTTRTHNNLATSTLTDSTGGTSNTTLVAITGTGDDANLNNNFADIAAQVNNIRTDLLNIKQVLNQVIDDLQAFGWLQ